MRKIHTFGTVLMLAATAALAQNAVAAKPFAQQSASQPSAPPSPAVQPECAPLGDQDLPLNSTIEANVTGLLDSAHLKPGKEITAQVISEWQFPGCNLSAGSTLYGHVTAATSSKDSGSQLGLVFDKGQCDGHAKKAISLFLIGVIGPPDQYVGLHGALPSEVSGGGRVISNAVGNGGAAQDENLDPGGAPHTVHPGIVVGMPKMKLDPNGGPDCSAKLASTDRSVRLGIGSELILTMQAPPEQQ
jgi:hypothetical protein